MLELTNCEKKYNGKRILHIPSLKLNRGIYWVQGQNGSGKTTFLRMMAGMIPFKGDISFNGISLRQQAMDYRRQISFAEAEPLYPSFITGSELVEFYQEIRLSTKDEIRYLVNLFQMNEYLSAPIASYSSGMTKKLSLTLALMGHPPLILLDEPAATLDTNAIDELPRLITNYQRDWNSSFIFSSHQAVGHEPFAFNAILKIDNQKLQLSA